MRIWDPHTGQARHTLTGHTRAVCGVGGRPGRHLAGLRRLRRETVRIWDPHTGQARHTLTGHTGGVAALAVAPDGSWLASAGDDATVRIWDPHTGQARHTLTGHTSAVRALAVAPDGSWLASAGDDATVRIWDPHTGQARHTLTGHTGAVAALAVAPDGSWLASAGARRDGADLGPAHRAGPPHPHRPHQPGGGVGGRPGRLLAGLRRRRRDGADLGRRSRMLCHVDPHRSRLRTVVTDGRRVAVAGDRGPYFLAVTGRDGAQVERRVSTPISPCGGRRPVPPAAHGPEAECASRAGPACAAGGGALDPLKRAIRQRSHRIRSPNAYASHSQDARFEQVLQVTSGALLA